MVEMTVDVSREHWLETYKSLIFISIEGFKFSALANGGAAVALLTYLGNVAGKSAPVPDMRYPMTSYIAGLFCVGIAMLSAYSAQYTLLEKGGAAEHRMVMHPRLLFLAAFFYVASLVAFGWGSWQAVVNFG